MKKLLSAVSLLLAGSCILPAADEISRDPDFAVTGEQSAQTVFLDDLTSVVVVSNPATATVTLRRDFVVESFLVVGGGGAGGACCGGGGGGGGVIVCNLNALAKVGTVFSLQAGAGGVPGENAGDGGNSSLTIGDEEWVALGGGGGGTVLLEGSSVKAIESGHSGGSGGGGLGDGSTGGQGLQPGSSAGGAGFNGGTGLVGRFGGGGGGAFGVGASPSVQGQGGNGGLGVECDITGDLLVYGAGGGGGVVGGEPGLGGEGAGAGARGISVAGGKGADGRGAGGGGGGCEDIGGSLAGGSGGAGGSGAVALRLRRLIPEGAPWGSLKSVKRDIFGEVIIEGELSSLGAGASARVWLVVAASGAVPQTNAVATLVETGRFSFGLQQAGALSFDEGTPYSMRLVFDDGASLKSDTVAFVCTFGSQTDIYYLKGKDAAGSSSFAGGDGSAGWTNALGEVRMTPAAGGDYVLPAGTLLRTGSAPYVFPGSGLWSLGGEMRVEQDSLEVKTAELVSGTLTVEVRNSANEAAIKGDTWTLRETSTLSLKVAGGGVSFYPSLVGKGEVRLLSSESAAGGVGIKFYGDNEFATGDWFFSPALNGETLNLYFSSSLAWPSSAIVSEGPVAIDIAGSEQLLTIDRGSLTTLSDLTLSASEASELVLDIPLACEGFTVEDGSRIVLAADNSNCSGTIDFTLPQATLELRHVNAIGQAALNLNGATLALNLTDFVGGLRLFKAPLSPFRLDLRGEASFDADGRIILFRLPMSESFDLSLIQGEPSISIPGFKGEYALGTTVAGDERLVYFFAGSDGNPVMEDCYRWKSQIRVKGYAGDTSPNVPVLVRISPARIAGFDYSLVDTEHLAFTAADGSLCDYWIEAWNKNGESLVWVRVPLLERDGRTTIDFWFDHDGPDCDSSPITFGSDEFVDKNNMQNDPDYTENSEAVSTREPFKPTLGFVSRIADGFGAFDVELAVSGATDRCSLLVGLARAIPENPDELDSWEELRVVAAALSNDQTTVGWHLDSGWGTDYLAARFFLCRNYRAVVYQALQGDGKAYIDLGRLGAVGDDAYELQFGYLEPLSQNRGVCVFGVRDSNNSAASQDTVIFNASGNRFLTLDYWKGDGGARLQPEFIPEVGTIYRATLSPQLRALDYLDGDTWRNCGRNEVLISDQGRFLSSLRLFSIGGESGSFPASSYDNFSGKLYAYTRNSVLKDKAVERLVPAKHLSSLAAGLVDLNSGRFYENAASAGSFAARGMTEQIVVGPLAREKPVAATANYRYRKPGFSIIGR